MDRRALFFFGAAILAGVLTPVTADELRWVPIWVSGLYVVLAVASYIDWRINQR